MNLARVVGTLVSPAAMRQDLRDAYRALRSSRSYALWVVGSLAIGMAVTIAALALLNAFLVLPFPQVSEQHRLARVAMSRNCGRPDCWTRMSAAADYEALREGLAGLEDLAAYTGGDVAVALPDPRSMRGMLTTANYFDVLGVKPALGRVFDANDARAHAGVAVIAHATWTREFDADPSVVGRSIRVANQFVDVVGVAPPHFVGIDRDRPGAPRSMSAGRSPDLWLPLWLADDVLPLTTAERRRQERDLFFVGRLKDGVDISQLQAEAAVIARRLAAARGLTSDGGRAEALRLWRVNPRHWHLGVLVVMPIPVLVLVIACVNAANLMLARASQRQREIAIRLAIGAGRVRIVRQLLFESALLAAAATAIAVPAAWWALQLASNPLNVPIPFDRLVLGLTILTAAATTLAFGLAPAIRASGQAPSSTLGAARSDAVPRQSRMRHALVIAQVTLSLGLLMSAWQLVATVQMQAVSGGTPGDRLLMARFDLQPLAMAGGEGESFYRELLIGASRLPGVEAAGLARHTAIWTFGAGAATSSILVWRPADGRDEPQLIAGGYAGGDLFDAVGLRVVAGRGFTEADRRGRPQVALVNESAAHSLNGTAVGSSLRIAPRGGSFESSAEVRIVGVIEPSIEPRLEKETPAPKVYLPSPIEPEPALTLYLRTTGSATAVALPLRQLVTRLNSRVPIVALASLDDMNERSYAMQLWLARAAAGLGAIGLLLAMAGLYGLSSYVVAMRSRELAIRIAVGASPRSILAMVLRYSLRIAGLGLILGAAAAIAVSRIIQSEYHGIHGLDLRAFAGAAILFAAAMLPASALPALRASRVDPVENLRDV